MVAISELMNVEAEPSANIAQRGELEGFRTCEVLIAGELEVCGFTFKRSDVETSPLRKRRVVAVIVPTRCLCPAMGAQEGRESKGLRGLRHSDNRALDGVRHHACGINDLDGIGCADD